MALSCAFAALVPGTVAAHGGNFAGIVLTVQANRGEMIIRQVNASGMPGVTAAFRIRPASALHDVHAGDRVSANLNKRVRPWVLSDVEALPADTGVRTIRNVVSLQEGDRVPRTAFVDQDGKPFTFAQLYGQNVVLAFIYTRCKDARMCPLITAKFAQLQEKFKNSDTHLVEVTLDPQYDTPAVLTKYAKLFGARSSQWTMATGDPNTLLDFDAQFGIQPFADPSIGLIHTERTAIIDKRGVIRYLIDDPAWEPAGIIAQIDELDHRASNPLARFDLALSRAAVAICGDRVAGFSGLVDLGALLAIVLAFGWGFYRIGRAISTAKS